MLSQDSSRYLVPGAATTSQNRGGEMIAFADGSILVYIQHVAEQSIVIVHDWLAQW